MVRRTYTLLVVEWSEKTRELAFCAPPQTRKPARLYQVPGSRRRRPQRAPVGTPNSDDKQGTPVYMGGGGSVGLLWHHFLPLSAAIAGDAGSVTITTGAHLARSHQNSFFFFSTMSSPLVGRCVLVFFCCARQDSLRPVVRVGQSLQHSTPHAFNETNGNSMVRSGRMLLRTNYVLV